MLLTAALCDLKPVEFWDMTYLEFNTWVKACNQKQKYQVQIAITQSYMTAALQRTKTMPKLESLLEDTEEQTDDKLFKKIQGLQQKMGGVR